MKTKDKILLGIVTIFLVILFVWIGFPDKNATPQNVYQVYLDGEKLGLIQDQDELLNLINEEQQDIKDTYKVDQVYPPNGFNILEYVTYDENITPANEVYEKIKEKSDFTIQGYLITITSPATENEEEKVTTIQVLDDDIYYEAEHNFITTFVDEVDYQAYIHNTQEEITDVGSYINHMEFEETVTIKSAYVSVHDKIFTDADELTQYLLYGTTEPTQSYIVQKGDTLASIAEASKLNVRELLIANPKYRGENAVLAIGDTLSNGIINPILTLYQEVRITEDVEQAFTKSTVVDYNMARGDSKVTQAGVTGLERITQEVRIINGERGQDANVISSVTIRESVEEITSVGPSYNYNIGSAHGDYIDTGMTWAWPTLTPYIITTDYEWRWGDFHNALDISGTGFGSPIYAAQDGTVVATNATCANIGWYGSMCGMSYGNYIVVQHANNFYTLYSHITTDLMVSVGDRVSKGQQIGHMGSSGSSTGAHLHFGFSRGDPLHGGKWYSPWSLFR